MNDTQDNDITKEVEKYFDNSSLCKTGNRHWLSFAAAFALAKLVCVSNGIPPDMY